MDYAILLNDINYYSDGKTQSRRERAAVMRIYSKVSLASIFQLWRERERERGTEAWVSAIKIERAVHAKNVLIKAMPVHIYNNNTTRRVLEKRADEP